MPTTTVENYLKEIFLFSHKNQIDCMRMGDIAQALDVSPGTATTMVKSLEESGFLNYKPRVGATLTEKGRKHALLVVRRHRLIEYFLVETLNMDWSEVHEEAEVLEHAISDRLLAKIDEHLNFPEMDPHGDPIPTMDGQLKTQSLVSLNECSAPSEMVVARITDQSPDFLTFLANNQLKPGSPVTIEKQDPVGETTEIKVQPEKSLTIGKGAASKILLSS